MIEKFSRFIESHELLYSKKKILLAVSGGVDSIVMCHLFYKLGTKFDIAHCNYGLRGTESDRDEAFIRIIANNYNVDCFVKKVDILALKKSRQSTQMLARELRYNWFKELCIEYGFNKLATAHHLNDCIETTLLNLCRGTGIRGLYNMLSYESNIIRPLLFATKDQIYAYANANNLTWREDSSNVKNNYKRNLIRNTVVPILRTLNPSLENTWASSLERIGQVQYLWLDYMQKLRKELISKKNDFLYIDVDKIVNEKWATMALFELVSEFGFSYQQVQDFFKINHNTGARIVSKTHTLYLDRKAWIVVDNNIYNQDDLQLLFAHTDIITTSTLHLKMQTIDMLSSYAILKSNTTAALDKTLLKFPLTIRKWKAGDSFYPLGMRNKKKVSDFLIDTKVPTPEKQTIYVLISEANIVWVVGYRIDERYKISKETKNVYEIKIS